MAAVTAVCKSCNGRSSIWLTIFFLVVIGTPLRITAAPFLLGNQIATLSVIPTNEEQAAALLEFLRQNPQYGANNERQIQANTEEVILVQLEDVTKLSNGLQEIGFEINDSRNSYQIS